MSRSPASSSPAHDRRVLIDEPGKRTIAWFGPASGSLGIRETSLRVNRHHELVVVRVLRSGLVHYQDLHKLKPLASMLEMPDHRLKLAIREHFPRP